MLIPKLRQQKAPEAQDPERVASDIVPDLNPVSIHVPVGLGKANAQRSPALPLSRLPAKAKRPRIVERRCIERFANHRCTATLAGVGSPTANPVFHEDRHGRRHRRPIIVGD